MTIYLIGTYHHFQRYEKDETIAPKLFYNFIMHLCANNNVTIIGEEYNKYVFHKNTGLTNTDDDYVLLRICKELKIKHVFCDPILFKTICLNNRSFKSRECLWIENYVINFESNDTGLFVCGNQHYTRIYKKFKTLGFNVVPVCRFDSYYFKNKAQIKKPHIMKFN